MSSPIDLTTLTFVKNYLTIGNSPSGQPIPVSSVAISGGVLTITFGSVLNPPVVYQGQQVQFANMQGASFLNGVVLTIATFSATQITCAISHGDYPTASDVGIVQPLVLVNFDDILIQQLITDASIMAYDLTGRDMLFDADGNPSGGMFNSVCSYTEIQDGNGSIRLFTRNAPIKSVSSLIVGSRAIPASSGLNVAGYVIDQTKRSLVLRPAGQGSGTFSNFGNFTGGFTYVFCCGVQNIQVIYTAGYSAPPGDLMEAVTKLVSLNYTRRKRPDLASEAMPNAGQSNYRSFAIQPDVWLVINKYRRQSTS